MSRLAPPCALSEQQQAQQHHANTLPEPTNKRGKRLYVGMDGVFVPLRDAFKHDKSLGDLSCRYGECKSGVVYEACQDKAGKDSRVHTHAYIATLDKVDAFGPLLGTWPTSTATMRQGSGRDWRRSALDLADSRQAVQGGRADRGLLPCQ